MNVLYTLTRDWFAVLCRQQMDYNSVPIHEFLSSRILALARARNAYSRGWIMGPLGDRMAWYEVKVEFGEDRKITHIMCQLYHREDRSALFSIHAQLDNGKPKAFRVIFKDIDKYTIVLSSIEEAAVQAYIDGQREPQRRL